MRVRIYAYDSEGRECYQHEAELHECFDDLDAPEYRAASMELEKAGRYWVGGGAAPLILLKAIGP